MYTTYLAGFTLIASSLALPQGKTPADLKRAASTPSQFTLPLINLGDNKYFARSQLAGQDFDFLIDTGSADTFVLSQPPDGAYPQIAQRPTELLLNLLDNSTAQGVKDLNLPTKNVYGGLEGTPAAIVSQGALQMAPFSFSNTTLDPIDHIFTNVWRLTHYDHLTALVGLGFPAGSAAYGRVLAAAFNQTKMAMTQQQQQQYLPIVPRLFGAGQIAQPIFTISLQGLKSLWNDSYTPHDLQNARANVGSLTIGGFPDGQSSTSYNWQNVTVYPATNDTMAIGVPSYIAASWSGHVEEIYLNGIKLQNVSRVNPSDGSMIPQPMLIDTGNPTLDFPPELMAQIVPNGAYANNANNATIPCSTVLQLTMQIEGRNYTLNPNDTVVPSRRAIDGLSIGGAAVDNCQFAGQIDKGLFVGDVFLRSIEVAMDYGDIWNSQISPPRIGYRSTYQP